jgi:hypothetical protein
MAASPASIAFGSGLQLLAEGAAAWIDRRQARHVSGSGQRRLGHHELQRTVGGRTVGEAPHLGEALGPRLGLQIVPVERPPEPHGLGGQPARGILGHEVMLPEAQRDAIDGLAAQRRQHALTPGHG